MTRRKQFRRALAIAGLTMAEWCEAEGVTEGHCLHVLAGRRASDRLMQRIDEFTAQQFARLRPAA